MTTVSPQNRRVLLVTNIPTPYRIPLFNELHTQLAAAGIGFKVVFAALGYPRRKWEIDMTECKFAWEVLQGGRLFSRNPESALFTYAGLGRILRAEPDALIIVGGFSFATARLWLGSFFRRTRYLIWSGAIPRKGTPDSWFTRFRRKLLIRRACGFIAYGTLARDYLISLGAPSGKVSIGINTVDTRFFQEQAAARVLADRTSSRQLKLIHVGELSRRKRVDLILRAVAALDASRQDLVLQLIGTGTEEQSLRNLANELGISNKVEFLGFKQKPEIAEYLAAADCFLFSTDFDIWGLVLVEAMAAGLVCLASVRAGATHDLIKEGVTGFAVDFADAGTVRSRLQWVLAHREEGRDIGAAAQRFIRDNASLPKSAAAFVAAIDQALGGTMSRSVATSASAGFRTVPARSMETTAGNR